MAEKRQRRRYDLRPQNRADVKKGITGAHLDMQGNPIGGTYATGEKFGTKAEKGPEITPKDMSLEGFTSETQI